MDIEKAKTDIVYFLEQMHGVELSIWQQDLLKKLSEEEWVACSTRANQMQWTAKAKALR